MLLFFDTETTGLPRDWRAPVSKLSNWPRVVQLAWLLAEPSGAVHSVVCHLIRPDGFTIPDAATAIHGITTVQAREHGIPLDQALHGFLEAVQSVEKVIAHNYSFDSKILGAEFLRLKNPNPFDHLEGFCTMLATKDLCKLPGQHGYKWPSLDELHTFLFGRPHASAHNAEGDVRACSDCYFELRHRGFL
jgi:DNA polymerase III epsilon subunit-like protein